MSTSERKQAINAALGSIRIEGLKPSTRTVERLNRYASGKISAKQMHQEALAEAKQIASSH